MALLALVLALISGALSAAPLLLQGEQNRYALDGLVSVLPDPGANMDLSQAQHELAAGRFQAVPRLPATFGFGSGAYWFHLDVHNADSRHADWILAIAYALLDHVDLYRVHADARIEVFRAGDRVPFAQRAIDHRHITLPLRMPAGDASSVFVRVQSESSIQVPMELLTSEAFLARAPLEHLGLGLYYGIMLGLFFYNLILFLATRDRTFLYYVLYVASFALGQLCLNGLAFQFLWPTTPDWANSAVLVSIGAGMICMLIFTRSFLHLPARFPMGDRAILTLIATLSAVIAFSPLLGYHHTILIETAHVFLLAAVIMACAVRVYRDGYTPARNFLLAWSVLLAGVVIYAALSFGLLPKVFLTEYGIQIGSAAEMILLSFALANRINTLRDENSRIQFEAREHLETRVSERTHELDHAMLQLRQANAALRDFSLRDGLTGVHNRRFFDQCMAEAWSHAQRSGHPLSLVMIDIDHFKQINDQHGHLVGDDCLRAMAQCLLTLALGLDERVVRFGGEEFVVILPQISESDALERAERLRNAIADLRVYSEGKGVNFTVSAGVATFRPTANESLNDLLRVTDRALYDAKRKGRNCVVVAATHT